MKYLYIFLAILFGLFAYWQFNDPDATKWVVVYGLVALYHLLAARGVFLKWSILLLTGATLVWMFSLVPGFMDWIGNGMPSITSEMKTDQPHIEVVREFLGLLIVVIGLVHLSIRAIKHKRT